MVALAVALGFLALTARVSATPRDYFVVDTQFQPGRSAVVEASGVFLACTNVEDLDATASADGPIRFTGEKQLSCGDGARVVMDYDVAFDPGTGRTAGTWRVSTSTLPGIQDGDGGLLIGDPGGCTVAVHADGCILDRLTLAD
jgi:hypothetical protein